MNDDTQNFNQNLDPTEVNKFNELASRWWDENSEFKPLHQINPLRVNYINERTSLAGKMVLDVGCGGGFASFVTGALSGGAVGVHRPAVGGLVPGFERFFEAGEIGGGGGGHGVTRRSSVVSIQR